ncbi:MAG: hypothetical protein KKA32_10705 [Actinobacteria bacterium]|nr:hypothetical protein [Actinomycetota bacterium]
MMSVSRNRLTRSTAAIAASLLVLLLAGCGSSTESGSEGVTTTTAGGAGAGTATTNEVVEETPGTPIDAGLAPIELTGPATSGAGEVPTFEWEAVDGAARYRLVVLDGDGEPLWAWNGAETSVNLGGLPEERPADISGPIITPGSSWSVAAFAADGSPLAVSVLRPVGP